MTSHDISILTTHRHAPQVFSLAGQGIKGSDAQVPQKDCDSHVVKDNLPSRMHVTMCVLRRGRGAAGGGEASRRNAAGGVDVVGGRRLARGGGGSRHARRANAGRGVLHGKAFGSVRRVRRVRRPAASRVQPSLARRRVTAPRRQCSASSALFGEGLSSASKLRSQLDLD